MNDTQSSEAGGAEAGGDETGREETGADQGPQAWHLPPPGIHVTGSQLRHRLTTAESIAEFETAAAPSCLGRILGSLRRK